MSEPNETVAELLRPLAESGDPRCEVLRCPGGPFAGVSICVCLDCGEDDFDHQPWGLRTDLESIVRAAGACGYDICLYPDGNSWRVDLVPQEETVGEGATKRGLNPGEAAARALVAAWEAQRWVQPGDTIHIPQITRL